MDEYYMSPHDYDDTGMDREISRVSDDEMAEYNDIEGIEGSYYESADEVEDELTVPELCDPNEKSTPGNPLYDADGNKIPYGFTRKDWEIRKKAVAEKQKEIQKRIEAEKKARQKEEPVKDEGHERTPDAYSEERYTEEPDVQEPEPIEEIPKESVILPDAENTPEAPAPHSVPQEHERADHIGDDYIRDNFAGHGESSIVDGKTLDTAPSEPQPDYWQYDFIYTLDPETNTITLNEYHGSAETVYIPPVAYDEQGREYDVRLAEDGAVFKGSEVESVKVSNEIPQENYEHFLDVQQAYELETVNKRQTEREGFSETPNPVEQSTVNPEDQVKQAVFGGREDYSEATEETTTETLETSPDNDNRDTSNTNDEIPPSEDTVPTDNTSSDIPEEDNSYAHNAGSTNRPDEIDAKISQEALNQQESSKNENNDSQDDNGTFVGDKNSLDEMMEDNKAGDGSNNVHHQEDAVDFDENELNNLENRGTLIDEYGANNDPLKNGNPKEKLVTSSRGTAVTGAVVVDGSMPIDGDTSGSYGSTNSAMEGMLGNADAISNKINSTVGQNNDIVYIDDLNEVLASTPKDASRAMAENYVREALKDSGSGNIRQSKEDEPGGKLDLSRPVKENLTDIHARMQEIKAKRTLIDSDDIQRTFKEGLKGTLAAAKTATGSDETDVGKGAAKAKQYQEDFEYIFGDRLKAMISSLERYRGELLSDASNKVTELIAKGKLSEKDIELTDLTGLTGEAKTKALSDNFKKKTELDQKLQKLGFGKNERKIFTENALRQELSAGIKARNEILALHTKNANIFTKEELAFVKSGDFLNFANKADDITNITHKYLLNSKNATLSSMSKKSLRSMSNMRDLTVKGAFTKLTKGQQAVIGFQNRVTTGSYFTKQYTLLAKKPHNFVSVTLHFMSRLDCDAMVALNKVIAYSNAAVTMLKITARVAGLALRDTAIGRSVAKIKQEIKRKLELQASASKDVFKAAANDIKKEAEKAAKKGLKLVDRKGVFAKKAAEKKTKKTAAKAGAKAASKALSATLKAGKLGAAVAKISATLSQVATFISTVGMYVLIGILIFIAVLEGFYMAGVIISGAGNMIVSLTKSVILAPQDDTVYWAENLLEKDEKRYQDALKRAEEPPKGKSYDGSKLYHYGHYEYEGANGTRRSYPTANFNPKKKSNWNHPNYYNDPDVELDTAHKQVSDNGIHIYYIDVSGNTIGSNTSNVKDVMTITTVMAGNWGEFSTDNDAMPVDRALMNRFNERLYEIMNPDPVYLESELYSCEGCATYPKYGNYLNDKILYAYECNDSSIYTKFNKLKSQGVKFFPTDTFVASSALDAKEYPEKLVPQTTKGCNITAKLDSSNVVQALEYKRDSSGHKIWDEEEGHYVIDKKRVLGVLYEYNCGTATQPGFTYNYERDYGSVFGDTMTSNGGIPYVKKDKAYGKATTYLESYQTDAKKSWQRAGFNTNAIYQRTTEKTPHAAIKCCYGHRDLNIYIPIITKEDLIAADGGKIKYKVPKKLNAETGEIEEWEEKETPSIVSYVETDISLKSLTGNFFKEDGFKGEQHLESIENIYNEDWHDLYGIDVYGDAALPDTLSRVGKTQLKTNTPAFDGVSDERISFVKEAYKYVGQIPYYYGGKASSTNYSSNKFGTTVRPDAKGRTKKGLDCSGFVQFVYCKMFGRELSSVGSTTKTFCSSLGLSKIAYKDLKPGDIGLVDQPGSSKNHIGIYAGDGMWVHCTGEPINTVVYKNTNMFRYYYRLR